MLIICHKNFIGVDEIGCECQYSDSLMHLKSLSKYFYKQTAMLGAGPACLVSSSDFVSIFGKGKWYNKISLNEISQCFTGIQ